jgi:hypothetical protein
LATTLDQEEAAWADLIQRIDGVEVVAAQGGHLALLLPSQGVPAEETQNRGPGKSHCTIPLGRGHAWAPERISEKHRYSIISISGTDLSGRKPISGRTSVRSDSFHRQKVQRSAALSCKRELLFSPAYRNTPLFLGCGGGLRYREVCLRGHGTSRRMLYLPRGRSWGNSVLIILPALSAWRHYRAWIVLTVKFGLAESASPLTCTWFSPRWAFSLCNLPKGREAR